LGSPYIPVWLGNWQRLGLIEVTYEVQVLRSGIGDAYGWVVEGADYAWAVEGLQSRSDTQAWDITFERGLVRPTAFGDQFFSVVSHP
jgi:hypothetical protein